MANNSANQRWLQQLRDEPVRIQVFTVDPQPSATVFRVPDILRSMSPAYHERKELQLGLHNRTFQTGGTQQLKVDIARSLHPRLVTTGAGSWESFANAVVADVPTARDHYGIQSRDEIADEVVPFLLALDALFLVVFFQFLNAKCFLLEEFEPLEPRLAAVTRTLIKSDLLLLENQLPMYLLTNAVTQLVIIRGTRTTAAEIEIQVQDEIDNLLKVAVNHLYPLEHPDRESSLGFLLCSGCEHKHNHHKTPRFYAYLDAKYPLDDPKQSLQTCKHVLDCVYVVVCGLELGLQSPSAVALKLDSLPSLSRLKAIGITVTATAATLDKIALTGCGYVTSARLILPKVNVYDFTETVLHNLAVHEQLTENGRHGDFRCFLQCMASLSNDAGDVTLLVEQGVVDNKVGGDVVGMWNRVMRGVYTPRPSGAWVRCYGDIHRHRGNRVKRWRREAWVLFFSKPWTFVGLLGAVAILFLTAVQTWFTVVNSGRRTWRWPS